MGFFARHWGKLSMAAVLAALASAHFGIEALDRSQAHQGKADILAVGVAVRYQ